MISVRHPAAFFVGLSGMVAAGALVLVSKIAIAQDLGTSILDPSAAAELARGDETAVWAVYLLTGILAAMGVLAYWMGKTAIAKWDARETQQIKAIAAMAEMNATTQSIVTAAFLTARSAGAGEVPAEVAAFMDETKRSLDQQRESLRRVFGENSVV